MSLFLIWLGCKKNVISTALVIMSLDRFCTFFSSRHYCLGYFNNALAANTKAVQDEEMGETYKN